MKKILYILFMVLAGVPYMNAQETTRTRQYQVPGAYTFDYKVTYEITREKEKNPETVIYYFPENGDYLSLESADSRKDKNLSFMVSTREGLMITFGEEPSPASSGKTRKVIKVIDISSMYKGIGEGIKTLAKGMAENDTASGTKKSAADVTGFIKTGRTMQVFGYTAEEYSKEFSREENEKGRSGTMSFWYAKVDFNPEFMFSMGIGNMFGGSSGSGSGQSEANRLFGMDLTQKNYLLTEIDFSEHGDKNGTIMKVTGIEKINFSKSTEGYYVKNYSGMSMREMMQKEMEEK